MYSVYVCMQLVLWTLALKCLKQLDVTLCFKCWRKLDHNQLNDSQKRKSNEEQWRTTLALKSYYDCPFSAQTILTRISLHTSLHIGQRCIANRPEQCRNLVSLLGNNPSFAGLVAPHFSPSTPYQTVEAVAVFRDSYQLVASLSKNESDLILVLLTKVRKRSKGLKMDVTFQCMHRCFSVLHELCINTPVDSTRSHAQVRKMNKKKSVRTV